MIGRKKIRQKGKLGLSRVFSEMHIGDKVALVKNLSFRFCFPERYQGRTGTVIGQQGRSMVVEITDGWQKKKFIVQKIHLKKLSS